MPALAEKGIEMAMPLDMIKDTYMCSSGLPSIIRTTMWMWFSTIKFSGRMCWLN